MNKIVLIFILPFLLAACIREPEDAENTYAGNMEALWRIVDTRYCYLDYKNINWDSVRNVYVSRIDAGASKQDYFDLLGEMLGELKDGHVNLYSDFNTSRYWKWFTDYPSNFDTDIIYGTNYLGDNYKAINGLHYAKIHGGKVGYIYYGSFNVQFSDLNMYNVLNYFKDCEALIIDVRNNGGGYLSMAEQFASYFFEEETVTGYISHKTGNGHSDFSKPEAIKTPSHAKIRWLRPVAVLANRKSYSSTNSFIARMKMAPYAIVVGDKSGGGGGLPMSSELPNGWMVRFSSSPMFDAEMNHTEWGIDPDVPAALLSPDASTGSDNIIETAIGLIIKKK